MYLHYFATCVSNESDNSSESPKLHLQSRIRQTATIFRYSKKHEIMGFSNKAKKIERI